MLSRETVPHWRDLLVLSAWSCEDDLCSCGYLIGQETSQVECGVLFNDTDQHQRRPQRQQQPPQQRQEIPSSSSGARHYRVYTPEPEALEAVHPDHEQQEPRERRRHVGYQRMPTPSPIPSPSPVDGVMELPFPDSMGAEAEPQWGEQESPQSQEQYAPNSDDDTTESDEHLRSYQDIRLEAGFWGDMGC